MTPSVTMPSCLVHICLHQDGWKVVASLIALACTWSINLGSNPDFSMDQKCELAQANRFLSLSFLLCKLRWIREMLSLCYLRIKWDKWVKLTAWSLAQGRMLPPWQVMCFLVNSLTPLPFSFAGGLAASGSVICLLGCGKHWNKDLERETCSKWLFPDWAGKRPRVGQPVPGWEKGNVGSWCLPQPVQPPPHPNLAESSDLGQKSPH